MGLVMKNCNQSCGASGPIPYLVGCLAIPTHRAGHAPPLQSAIRRHWHHAEWAVALAIVRHIGKPLPCTCPPPGPTRAGLRTPAPASLPPKTPPPPMPLPPPWPSPRWIAHRGAGLLAPENPLAAFRLGARHGYRMFECDAKLSRDGVPFLLHDTTLERTTNSVQALGQGASRTGGDHRWSALSRLDAGAWHSPGYAGEPLPPAPGAPPGGAPSPLGPPAPAIPPAPRASRCPPWRTWRATASPMASF